MASSIYAIRDKVKPVFISIQVSLAHLIFLLKKASPLRSNLGQSWGYKSGPEADDFLSPLQERLYFSVDPDEAALLFVDIISHHYRPSIKFIWKLWHGDHGQKTKMCQQRKLPTVSMINKVNRSRVHHYLLCGVLFGMSIIFR